MTDFMQLRQPEVTALLLNKVFCHRLPTTISFNRLCGVVAEGQEFSRFLFAYRNSRLPRYPIPEPNSSLILDLMTSTLQMLVFLLDASMHVATWMITRALDTVLTASYSRDLFSWQLA